VSFLFFFDRFNIGFISTFRFKIRYTSNIGFLEKSSDRFSCSVSFNFVTKDISNISINLEEEGTIWISISTNIKSKIGGHSFTRSRRDLECTDSHSSFNFNFPRSRIFTFIVRDIKSELISLTSFKSFNRNNQITITFIHIFFKESSRCTFN